MVKYVALQAGAKVNRNVSTPLPQGEDSSIKVTRV